MSEQLPRWVRRVAAVSVAVVAAVAAVVSYAHMFELATSAGEGWRSWLEPLSVDGLLIGSSLVLLSRRSRRWLAWLAVAVGLLVSLAANLAAAAPGLVAHLVAGWPAVALALSYETLLSLLRPVVRQDGRQVAEVAPASPVAAGELEPASLAERARVLAAAGAGRGRVARELGVSEHHARRLLAEVAS